MSLFLFIFFLLYSLMHLYVFLRAKTALTFGLKSGILIALVMLFMIFAPITIRMSEKAGYDLFAHVMSYIGYIWMGIMLLFISVGLTLELYRFLLFILKIVVGKDLSGISPTVNFSFYAPLVLSIIISAYGYFEALNITTERIAIKTSKLPEKINRLKIVQISDVHLGLIIREKRLNRILNIVRQENPDILVSTGDLVDGEINNLTGLSEMLREIKPKLGKYAITGNHEFYAGIKRAIGFTESAGFKLLRGEAVMIDGIINIAGVDDIALHSDKKLYASNEREMLVALPKNVFTLLLKHRPTISMDSLGLFDLQISGHTHKGQIFPFSIITWLYYPVHAGCLQVIDSCYLYVSRGSGTWGPPIRFLSPPEVTVFELTND